ncbi:MAG TPA: ribosome-associated translation inhibitor RaiA [Candidatus Saccharimonadales bacterium]|nr:ribosome-associated translation inhibitor RaiA [Candidatus Saccharimonadales bacterium]
MIKNIEVSAIHMKVDDDLQRYIQKKIGLLDKYTSRRIRTSLRADVMLKEEKSKDKNSCTCEVIIHLPNEKVTISETTINLYAAVDIVEAKLKTKLKKYKEMHSDPKFYRHMFKRRKDIFKS